MTLTGWLSIKGFLVVNLVVTLINHFLSDIKYLYGSIYFKVNKNKKLGMYRAFKCVCSFFN